MLALPDFQLFGKLAGKRFSPALPQLWRLSAVHLTALVTGLGAGSWVGPTKPWETPRRFINAWLVIIINIDNWSDHLRVFAVLHLQEHVIVALIALIGPSQRKRCNCKGPHWCNLVPISGLAAEPRRARKSTEPTLAKKTNLKGTKACSPLTTPGEKSSTFVFLCKCRVSLWATSLMIQSHGSSRPKAPHLPQCIQLDDSVETKKKSRRFSFQRHSKETSHSSKIKAKQHANIKSRKISWHSKQVFDVHEVVLLPFRLA